VDSPFCVVNFYHLHAVEAPEDELQRHRDYIEQAGLDIKYGCGALSWISIFVALIGACYYF
jgi:hypothetical protein